MEATPSRGMWHVQVEESDGATPCVNCRVCATTFNVDSPANVTDKRHNQQCQYLPSKKRQSSKKSGESTPSEKSLDGRTQLDEICNATNDALASAPNSTQISPISALLPTSVASSIFDESNNSIPGRSSIPGDQTTVQALSNFAEDATWGVGIDGADMSNLLPPPLTPPMPIDDPNTFPWPLSTTGTDWQFDLNIPSTTEHNNASTVASSATPNELNASPFYSRPAQGFDSTGSSGDLIGYLSLSENLNTNTVYSGQDNSTSLSHKGLKTSAGKLLDERKRADSHSRAALRSRASVLHSPNTLLKLQALDHDWIDHAPPRAGKETDWFPLQCLYATVISSAVKTLYSQTALRQPQEAREEKLDAAHKLLEGWRNHLPAPLQEVYKHDTTRRTLDDYHLGDMALSMFRQYHEAVFMIHFPWTTGGQSSSNDRVSEATRRRSMELCVASAEAVLSIANQISSLHILDSKFLTLISISICMAFLDIANSSTNSHSNPNPHTKGPKRSISYLSMGCGIFGRLNLDNEVPLADVLELTRTAQQIRGR
ncbi:MAG: hypothetical protein Q9160_006304 [Pyrenula sp. 1 TL-2023]